MDNKLIVRPKTEVAAQAEKKDILAIYGVPETLDKVVEKEKRDLVNYAKVYEEKVLQSKPRNRHKNRI